MKKCCKCHVNPRQDKHNYCRPCQLEYNRERAKKSGGWWATRSAEAKRRAVVRRYVMTQYLRGKIERKPCEVCGEPGTEFHHLNYETMSMDVRHLCHKHHMEEEAKKKQLLTKPAIPS